MECNAIRGLRRGDDTTLCSPDGAQRDPGTHDRIPDTAQQNPDNHGVFSLTPARLPVRVWLPPRSVRPARGAPRPMVHRAARHNTRAPAAPPPVSTEACADAPGTSLFGARDTAGRSPDGVKRNPGSAASGFPGLRFAPSRLRPWGRGTSPSPDPCPHQQSEFQKPAFSGQHPPGTTTPENPSC